VKRVELSSRAIEHFASQGFVHTRVARGDVHVSFARLDGVIGGHDAASRQLLTVLSGRVECASAEERSRWVSARRSSGRKESGTKRVL
jgi:hypothetical protein